MTLIVLRIMIFKMKEIWQHHAKTDMHKRLASVHSIIGRGSLIPLPTIDVGETSQIKQQAFRATMPSGSSDSSSSWDSSYLMSW